jgi:uncharacterized protein (TIGR03435 family)
MRYLLVLACCLPAFAQAPAFEAATIKPSQAEDFRRVEMKFLPGGRLVATNFPLQVLIATAYDVPYQSARLTGGPDWIRSNRFDVEAVAPTGAIPGGASSKQQHAIVCQMLQALLADRFKLAIRKEPKEMPVYLLAVAKSGPKLEHATINEQDCGAGVTPDGISCHAFLGGQGRGLHGQAVDMNDLARAIENFTDRVVVNRTALDGLYHIETSGWINMRGKLPAPGDKAEDGRDFADVPTLFRVLDGLGLKLENGHSFADLLTITHVEKL